MNTEKIAVVGAGTMGAGIAQMALEAGHQVSLIDTEQASADRGAASVRGFLDRKVAKDTLSERDFASMLERLEAVAEIEAGVDDSAMVVEAVYEDLDLKHEVFAHLDRVCPPDVILASNTSTLPITKIATAVEHPERVIGTHYFSPVPMMKLVEVVRGDHTSDDVAERTLALCEGFGKTPVLIEDVPGFIVNRFLCLLYNEAANMIHGGVATAEDIDTALKLGCNWPMGPTEIMDLAGVDVTLLALQAMHDMTGEDRYDPSPLLKAMVEQEHLGRKTGVGFYDHR